MIKKITSLAVLLVCVGTISATPIVYYKMSEPLGTGNVPDHSGNNYHGGLWGSGSQHWTGESFYANKDGKATSYAHGPSSASHLLRTDNSFSWSVSIKPDPSEGMSGTVIYRGPGTAWQAGTKAITVSSNDEVRFQVHGQSNIAATVPGLWSGIWTHVAVTYDVDTNDVLLYINGVKANSANHNLAEMPEGDDWGFHYGYAATGWYKGEIKEIKLYDINWLREKTVKNPYEKVNWEQVNQYIANLHCHTTQSDGAGSPGEMIHLYADAGYHILAITDHDVYGPGTDSENPVPSPTWPWTDYIEEEPSQIWMNGSMETSAFYPDLGEQGMLAIKGNEPSTQPHIVSLFNNCGWPDHGGQCDDERLGCVETQGGLSYYAHPYLYLPGALWYEIVGANIFESPADLDAAVKYYGDFITSYDSCLGFEMQLTMPSMEVRLFDQLLQKYYRNHNIFIKGSDDNHGTSIPANAALTIVLATDLSEEAVRYALKNGHNFVGSRSATYPVFNSITVDEEQQKIILDIDNYDSIRWIKNGEVYDKGEYIDYSKMVNDVLRFEVDHGGATFYSQGFYIIWE